MPELPDVETWKRYVDSTSLHHRISAVEVDAPRMLKDVSAAKLRAALGDGRLESTTRHGKFLFVRHETGQWLLLHFGMTGFLAYARESQDPPAHTRLQLRFSNGYRLAGAWPRRLGRIGLVEDPAGFVARQGLGPDALDPGLDGAAMKRMLRRRRGSVKAALMDQAFIAGIGNVYSDEILFQAGLHPRAEADKLGDRHVARLRRALLHVLRIAIERQADPTRMPESWLLPQRRKGGRCPRCEGRVSQAKVAGRTAWLCPACQR